MSSLESLKQKITNYLEEGRIDFSLNPQGFMEFSNGNMTMMIAFDSIGEHNVAAIMTPLAVSVESITEDLTRFMLIQTQKSLFGKLCLDSENGIIWLMHSLLGDQLDREELFITISVLTKMAEENQNIIPAISGGASFYE